MVFTIHSIPIDEKSLSEEFEKRAAALEGLLATESKDPRQVAVLRDSLYNIFSCLPEDLKEQNQKKYDFLVGSSNPRYN